VFPSLRGHDGDTFRTRFADRTLEDALVTFVLTPGGSVDEIGMKATSASADCSYDYQDLVFKAGRRMNRGPGVGGSGSMAVRAAPSNI